MAAATPAQAAIHVTEVTWLGNKAWKIEGAANGTFYFENGRTSGRTGFSSAVDQDSKDWIYNNGNDTSDGANHRYRGFPQLGADGFNHPQQDSQSQSSWVNDQMDGEALIMESWNPNFRVQYHFFSSHIALKILEAKQAYTFLYEGPIGGKQQATDWMVGQIDGMRRIVPAGKDGYMDPAYPDKKFGRFFTWVTTKPSKSSSSVRRR